MGLFKKLFQHNSPQITVSIDPQTLENAIYQACLRIEAEKTLAAQKKNKPDHLSEYIKAIICILLLVSLILLLFSFLYNLIYCFSSDFKSIISHISQCFFYVTIFAFILPLFKLIKKETDRFFIVAYLSALTSLFALFVASFR